MVVDSPSDRVEYRWSVEPWRTESVVLFHRVCHIELLASIPLEHLSALSPGMDGHGCVLLIQIGLIGHSCTDPVHGMAVDYSNELSFLYKSRMLGRTDRIIILWMISSCCLLLAVIIHSM